MSRCVCCNYVLMGGELSRNITVVENGVKYVVPDDMCSRCREAAYRPRDWHEHQHEHLTEQLFSVYGRHFTTYDE